MLNKEYIERTCGTIKLSPIIAEKLSRDFDYDPGILDGSFLI